MSEMEMRTQQPSKRGSMEEEDRLSSLPDDLLHSILRELPLKHAVRTSALSRRWAPQWLRALTSSRVLDFTDPDLARGRLPAPAAAAVRRCLELHAEHGAPLDVLRVALRFPPEGSSFGAFQRDVVGWIASAVARGATELEVELEVEELEVQEEVEDRAAFVELPGDVFVARNSLARLALGGFSIRAVPAAPTGLAGLRSLSLNHVDIIGEVFRDVVSSCRVLEHLRLSNSECELIAIASETLRVLEMIGCIDVMEVQVTAPALESIAFHHNKFIWDGVDDYLFDFDDDMPALRDVYISRMSYNPDGNTTTYETLLSAVKHAPVWTISCDDYSLPVMFDTENIQELQLRIARDNCPLEYLTCFFRDCKFPLLDRLFVRLPGHVTDVSVADEAAALASEVVDDSDSEPEIHHNESFVPGNLNFIKLVNFRGTRLELQLLAFFLKYASALEHLVLVTVGEEGGATGPGDEHLEDIQRHVSAMLKVSPDARLTVCRPSQDSSQNPAHTKFYDELLYDDDE